MKNLVMILVILTLTRTVIAEDIVTLSGTTYTNAKVTRAESDGITVMWSRGVAKIPFSDLPAETQTKYGYDSDKASQYSRTMAEAQRNAAQLQERRAQIAAQAAEIEKQKASLFGEVMQKTSAGLLIDCAAPSRPILNAAARSGGFSGGVGEKPKTKKTEKEPPPSAYGNFLLVGHPQEASLVDGSLVNVVAFPAGTYSYTCVTGANRTVKRYAMSAQQACALLMQEER